MRKNKEASSFSHCLGFRFSASRGCHDQVFFFAWGFFYFLRNPIGHLLALVGITVQMAFSFFVPEETLEAWNVREDVHFRFHVTSMV
jgi:hypothetical protein